MESLRALVRQSGARYRFVGLSLSDDGLEDYIKRNRISFPVYGALSRETIDAYKLGTTPMTIAVSQDAMVLAVWFGAYGGPAESSIESFFDVRLPSLPPSN